MQPSPPSQSSLIARIDEVLDDLRLRLQLDECDLDIIELGADGTLRVQLTGGAACCPIALATLQAGIENAVRERVPEVRRVVAVGSA